MCSAYQQTKTTTAKHKHVDINMIHVSRGGVLF